MERWPLHFPDINPMDRLCAGNASLIQGSTSGTNVLEPNRGLVESIPCRSELFRQHEGDLHDNIMADLCLWANVQNASN